LAAAKAYAMSVAVTLPMLGLVLEYKAILFP